MTLIHDTTGVLATLLVLVILGLLVHIAINIAQNSSPTVRRIIAFLGLNDDIEVD